MPYKAGEGRPPMNISESEIRYAMENTQSCAGAARFLKVSYEAFRKYAKLYKDDETGQSLFELHKNQAGKGIPKFLSNRGKEPPLMDLLEGRIPIEHFDAQKVKSRIIQECLLEEKCAKCDFMERRVHDTKVPIVLTHKDKNRKNWRLDNLEFLCYNCAFLYYADPITEQQVQAMEDYVDKSKEEFNWEMDQHHIDHLKELGLYEEENPGDEFIERL